MAKVFLKTKIILNVKARSVIRLGYPEKLKPK